MSAASTRYAITSRGCWEWTGPLNERGYGRSGPFLAHRVVYEELVKKIIPEGLQLDHLCRNRCCVNPAHLEIVTGRENTLRGNSVPGVNGRKTHCYRGHPFSPENIYRSGRGGRECRTCRTMLRRRQTERQRDARARLSAKS